MSGSEKIYKAHTKFQFIKIATFIQNVADWVVLTGKNVAQISDGISNPVIWDMITILVIVLA